MKIIEAFKEKPYKSLKENTVKQVKRKSKTNKEEINKHN